MGCVCLRYHEIMFVKQDILGLIFYQWSNINFIGMHDVITMYEFLQMVIKRLILVVR